jgi:hypothetical protein
LQSNIDEFVFNCVFCAYKFIPVYLVNLNKLTRTSYVKLAGIKKNVFFLIHFLSASFFCISEEKYSTTMVRMSAQDCLQPAHTSLGGRWRNTVLQIVMVCKLDNFAVYNLKIGSFCSVHSCVLFFLWSNKFQVFFNCQH